MTASEAPPPTGMARPGQGDFTAQAEAYARARPGYPAAIVGRLAARVGVAPGDPVVELGAGTGLFTRHLSDAGLRVVALEPTRAMRDLAPALPGVEWRDGTFEETGLPRASQAWAVAAQAFHWSDPVRALPELRRVLQPGAAFTALWNDRDPDRSEPLRLARTLIQQIAPGFDEGYRTRDWGAVLTSTGDFAAVEGDEERHVVLMDRDRFLDLWRSHNTLRRAIGQEGVQRLVGGLANRLPTGAPLPIAYRCRSWTVWAVA